MCARMADMEQMDIMQNAERALKYLDDEVVGYEEQERQVEDLLIDFLQTHKGQCCLLEGEANCGRESVLEKVLRKYKMILRVINVGYVAADPLYQESLAREDDEGCTVFLVRDADEMITAHQQEFLYTMVDKATNFSWLVFFSISKHNFSQNLEKRGNSRMPRIRITFEQNNDFKEYCENFRKLMMPSKSEVATNSKYFPIFVHQLKSEKWLKPIFERYNYDVLKQIVAQILMRIAYFCDKDQFVKWNDQDIEQIVEETIEFAMPGYNTRLKMLHDQTLRSQCVFLCIWRIIHNRKGDTDTTTPEYQKLVNTHYKMLTVSSDVFIFREIDHLAEIGLVKADKNTNVTNASFRKVWIDIDPLTVEKSITTLKMPTLVQDFFVTIRK